MRGFASQMKSPVRESELQKAIIEYLNKIGMLAWRNNTGAYVGEYKGKKRFIRFGIPGASDIFAIDPKQDGRFICIEVKAHGKKPTPNQYAWMVNINNHCGFACWVASWEDWEWICKEKGWPV